MKTYWNYSIVLLLIGIVSTITGGSFWLLPESWTGTTIILGKFALYGGIAVAGYNVLVHAIRELKAILMSHREGIQDAIAAHADGVARAAEKISSHDCAMLATQTGLLRAAQCQANIAAGTALTADDAEKVETLLKRLQLIGSHEGRYAATARSLHAKLSELQQTRDGLKGPALIKNGEQFVTLFDDTVGAYSLVTDAEDALKAAEDRHGPLLKQLNDFAA